jgi:hypothetical protein
MKKNILIFLSISIFAALLWLYLSLNLSYTITLSVPLEVNVTKSQALASEIPPSIKVTIKGKYLPSCKRKIECTARCSNLKYLP